jgi:hypothetical protein
MTATSKRGLTFDMRGGRNPQGFGRPLDGRVRPHWVAGATNWPNAQLDPSESNSLAPADATKTCGDDGTCAQDGLTVHRYDCTRSRATRDGKKLSEPLLPRMIARRRLRMPRALKRNRLAPEVHWPAKRGQPAPSATPRPSAGEALRRPRGCRKARNLRLACAVNEHAGSTASQAENRMDGAFAYSIAGPNV